MEPTTTIAIVTAVAIAALVLVLVTGRSRRDRATDPVRLGPRWTPPGTDPAQAAQQPTLPDDERVDILVEGTGLERPTVAVVLNAWDEYLAVLGLLDLPLTHHYRVYDPYDPPVAERRDGRPVADPVRVARDVARREGVSEHAATTVLDVLRDEPADRPAGRRAE